MANVIPGTNIPVPQQPVVNQQVQPMTAKDGHVMTEDEIKAYKEQWQNNLADSDKLIENAVKLLQFEPAVLTYFSLCELKPIKDPQVTMRLNCRGTGSAVYLEYNPIWMNRIKEASVLSYCIYCECLRIALHHPTTRKCYPIDCFKKASDYICFDENQRGVLNTHKPEVLALLDTFPTKAKFHEEAKGYKFQQDEDWFLEKVFTILNDIKQKSGQGQGQQQQQQGGGQGQGQGGGGGKNGNQQGQGQGQGQGNGQGNQQGQGNGQGNGKGNSKGNGNDTQQALEEYLDSSEQAAEKATEGWEENTLVDQEIQEITHHIAENGSRWGNVSGGLLQAILAANTPKFDPRTVLRRFKANTVDKYTEDTRMRPDRRKGFDVPGKRHKFRSRILIAIDCSGSMSDEDVERGCAIINKFVKHADVSYCFWDGVCGPFTQQKQKSTEFKLIGRGCTNPDCVLEAIKERKAKFDGLVFITDNGFCWERPEHMANKIFLIHTADACEPPEWIKYILSFKQLFSIED